jgi:hypothetical protein
MAASPVKHFLIFMLISLIFVMVPGRFNLTETAKLGLPNPA